MTNYRKIMEQKIGRKLKSSEIVHHKDGNNYNDSEDNLQLISSRSKHSKIPKKKQQYVSLTDAEISTLLQQKETELFNTALQNLFTPYQSKILLRKFYSEKLSKTDKEVFCRTIKPRLRAIINDALIKIAKTFIYA